MSSHLPVNLTLDEPVNTVISDMLNEFYLLEGIDLIESKAECPYHRITTLDQLSLFIKEDRIHPEALGLSRFNFHLAGTLNYGPIRFRGDNPQSENNREQLIRKLMSRVRVGLGLRGKQFHWVATTEYGYENRIHSHFLLNLGVKASLPSSVHITQVESAFGDLAKEMNEEVLGTLHLSPITHSIGAVAYLCKEEYRRPMKYFIYSQSIVSKD
jgi:hypothetical protein